MEKVKIYDYYMLEDKRFFDKPYGVLRTEAARARVERYQPSTKTWDLAQSEAQIIWDPDPGESANPVTEEQCLTLIDSGTLEPWS